MLRLSSDCCIKLDNFEKNIAPSAGLRKSRWPAQVPPRRLRRRIEWPNNTPNFLGLRLQLRPTLVDGIPGL